MKPVIIIPASMQSKRLPGKPMLMAGGKPLVQWTYERAKGTGFPVYVATSDDVIWNWCWNNNIAAVRTHECTNGTERCWWAVEGFDGKYDIVINWQVDEPLVNPEDVCRLSRQKLGHIATLVAKLKDEDAADPNVVKVIVSGIACFWFSRAAMAGAYHHIGVYSFDLDYLRRAQSSFSHYSEAESLEQLAWLEYRMSIAPIMVGGSKEAPLSINTPEDWEEFKRMKENGD